jgi:dihydropteroate synthase
MTPLSTAQFDAADRALGGYGRTLVMGILNVTPDSFTDGGHYAVHADALARAALIAIEGADILDIGGESTRPGATAVSAEEELARVLPVLREVVPSVSCPVSIDTYKASVAAEALACGVRIVNDVWGLQHDPAMADVVASAGAAVVLMHNRRLIEPGIDIVGDVMRFLDVSLTLATKAGIPEHRIAVDPGIGFGKTLEQNLQLIGQLGTLSRFGVSVLLGASRKSVIDRISPAAPTERLGGTIALHSIGILGGADLVRVHDVAPAVQAARVTDRIKQWWAS